MTDIPNDLKGEWKDVNHVAKYLKKQNFFHRERIIKGQWVRLHSTIPEFLNKNKNKSKFKCLDVGCGNGATLEILRWYGHECIGMDYTDKYSTGDWKYKSCIESQNLNCINHSGTDIPYPFKNKEFDLLICYAALTFLQPIEKWTAILNEFARITSKCILICPNRGMTYDNGKKYIDNWIHNDFKLEWNKKTIYKYVSN